VAYTLMFWNRKLTSREQDDLARWAGFAGGSAVRTVINKLTSYGL
jgi:hypothetical protein